MPRDECRSRALVYAGIVGAIQAIGQTHGYAIAVHGSMATDLDLIAAPWTDGASDAEALVDAVCARLNGYVPLNMAGSPFNEKPHGRRAYSIHFEPSEEPMMKALPDDLWQNALHAYIDLSVMPKTSKALDSQPAATKGEKE